MMEAGRFIPAKTNMAFSRKRKKNIWGEKGIYAAFLKKHLLLLTQQGDPAE